MRASTGCWKWTSRSACAPRRASARARADSANLDQAKSPCVNRQHLPRFAPTPLAGVEQRFGNQTGLRLVLLAPTPLAGVERCLQANPKHSLHPGKRGGGEANSVLCWLPNITPPRQAGWGRTVAAEYRTLIWSFRHEFSVIAHMDTEPPEGGRNPRPLLKVKIKEPLELQFVLTNDYPHGEKKNVTVR